MLRQRLRLTLLVSAAVLLGIALVCYMLGGFVWALWPFSLAFITLGFSFGRWDAASFAYFRDDIAAILKLRSPSADGAETVPAYPVYPPAPAAPQSRPADIAGASVADTRGAVGVRSEQSQPADVVEDAPVPAHPAAPAMSHMEQGAMPAAHTSGGAPAADAPDEPPAWMTAFAARERSIAHSAIAAAVVLIAFSLLSFPAQGNPSLLAWASYLLAIVLGLSGLAALEGGWSRLAMRVHGGVRISISRHRFLAIAALAAILLFGLGVRIYNIDELPAGLYYDELVNIGAARALWEDLTRIPVYVGGANLTSLPLIPVALVIELAGEHVTSGRLVAAGFGVAGITAMFLMVRHMLGTLMGLVAAFLTAVMRWDLNWSRIGMHGFTTPFFAAMTAFLTYRALQSGRASHFGYAGAMMGLSMWYYAPLRMFPIVVGFVLLHALVFGGDKRTLLRNIVVMGLFALLVASPVLKFAITTPEEFFHRTQQASIFSHTSEGEQFSALIENFRKHILMFHIKGDPNGRHNLPDEPMLDLLSGLLMLGGVAVALWRWRIAAFIVLPVWVLVMLMPGVLSIPWEGPQSLRSIAVIPAVIALICLAIDMMWRWARSGRLPMLGKAAPVALVLLLGVIAYSNLHTYFVRQANDERVYTAFSTDLAVIAEEMTQHIHNGRAVWISEQHKSVHHTLDASGLHKRIIAAPSGIPLTAAESPLGADIYLELREPNLYETLREYYPNGGFREFRPPAGGEPFLYKVTLNADVLASVHGLAMLRTLPDGSLVASKHTGDLHVRLADGDTPTAVELAGLLHIDRPGVYALDLQGGVDAELILDGVSLLNDAERSVRIDPAVGLHTLRLRARGGANTDSVRLVWQPPDADAPQVVPAASLFDSEHLSQIGLTARYYDDPAAAQAGAAPDLIEIVPHIGRWFWLNPPKSFNLPYLVVMEGALHVPESGDYVFNTNRAIGSMDVYLDGEHILNSNAIHHHTIPLAEGTHTIRLERTFTGSPYDINLKWAPPHEPLRHIPPHYATPHQTDLFHIVSVSP